MKREEELEEEKNTSSPPEKVCPAIPSESSIGKLPSR